ncbi:hypothetical protein K1X13_17500 [Nocardioides sp. WL0053]|uniref:Uncharacterized protein n=1 Tax=Nocardioides jiangsuensis TaxID=2866161 RepID=A0ABS7RNK2_9ACTN|nr:hypothetical protein [Nocardioides jiangsuensis]MBY9076633.1 hypothetical protein [Nocardioides jiangsuensis]
MTRTARQPHEWLTLGAGLVAASMWASLGLRAIVMDSDPSVKALFACAALVLVGFALGSVTWIVIAPKRAKRPPADAVVLAKMKAPFAMLGIMLVGSGASPIVDPTTGAWGWALLVAASLVGGLNLGVAFMGIAEQGAPSDAPRQSTVAPQSGA